MFTGVILLYVVFVLCCCVKFIKFCESFQVIQEFVFEIQHFYVIGTRQTKSQTMVCVSNSEDFF